VKTSKTRSRTLSKQDEHNEQRKTVFYRTREHCEKKMGEEKEEENNYQQISNIGKQF